MNDRSHVPGLLALSVLACTEVPAPVSKKEGVDRLRSLKTLGYDEHVDSTAKAMDPWQLDAVSRHDAYLDIVEKLGLPKRVEVFGPRSTLVWDCTDGREFWVLMMGNTPRALPWDLGFREAKKEPEPPQPVRPGKAPVYGPAAAL